MFVLLTVLLAWGADDDWAKVRALRGGTEIRVFKKGSAQPIVAKMDEASDENLVVVLKNEQVAIPRDQIDRVDARPAQAGGKSTKTTTTTTKVDPTDGKAAAPPSQVKGPDGPSSSTSTSVVLGGSKGDFETVYRRRTGATARP
jgi:hypothetical protein